MPEGEEPLDEQFIETDGDRKGTQDDDRQFYRDTSIPLRKEEDN